MADSTDVCERDACSSDASFAFYNPHNGQTMLLCTDHLDGFDDFFDVRTWVSAGYALPIEEWQGPRSLPRTPTREDQQQARRAVDQMLRGHSPSHNH